MARAKRIYILIIKVKLFSFFLLRCFLKEIENMFAVFLSSYRTIVEIWENSKKLWKHSPSALVPKAFLILPNFHSCFYVSIETRYMFFISLIMHGFLTNQSARKGPITINKNHFLLINIHVSVNEFTP